MSRTAYLVVDLGFGDAGKGLLTDHLARTRPGVGAVVRFNGGAQAGHNVVTPEGRHHCFAQLGAGSFVPGVRTLLSRHFVLHPSALLVEAGILEGKGVPAPLEHLCISEEALVVTPFHQALNRLRELARGTSRHGSCGVGVGETVAHSLRFPDEAMHARHLRDFSTAHLRLERVRDRALAEARGLGVTESDELGLLEDAEASARYLSQLEPLRHAPAILSESDFAAALESAGNVVFEGAQGVLLDENHGFHPHTTWSHCTFENALELTHGFDVVRRLGVLRALPVRHGPGPFPTASSEVTAAVAEPHNVDNPWQGEVRHGWFDRVLARYALDVVGGVDALAITHLDAVERLGRWKLTDSYAELPVHRNPEPDASLLRKLESATPRYAVHAPAKLREILEEALGVRVRFESRGPRSTDITERG